MAEKAALKDVAKTKEALPDGVKSWEELGLEALPGWVIFRAVDDGPKRTPGGLEIVSLDKEMRPTVVEVLSAGPQRHDENGKPDGFFVPDLAKGTRVLVPEYGVKIHSDPLRGDLRCYEYRQLLALVVADAPGTVPAADARAKK